MADNSDINTQDFQQENRQSSDQGDMNINPSNQANTPQDYSYRTELEKKSMLDPKIIVVVVAGLGFLTLILWFLFFRGSSEETEDMRQISPTEIVEQSTPTVEPTEVKEVTIADLKIQVLNGSGVAGEAGKVSKILEGKGFSGIETDNADSYNFTTTQVRIKSNAPENAFETIEEALGDDYQVELGDALGDDSNYDVVVTIGKKKGAKEVQPTSSLTPTPTDSESTE